MNPHGCELSQFIGVNTLSHSVFCVVPDVVHLSLEKLGPCFPLDLSRGLEVTAPLAPDPSYYNECARADKEDTQMLTNPSSKAIPDGRGASTASGNNSFYEQRGLH